MNRERWDWKFPEGFPKKHQLLVVLLVGILLVIIAIPTPKPGESLEKERTSEQMIERRRIWIRIGKRWSENWKIF